VTVLSTANCRCAGGWGNVPVHRVCQKTADHSRS